MVSPASPLDIKNRGKPKSPLNSIPERTISPNFSTDRIINTSRLVSPPGVQHLSKSQPKASFQNKLEPFTNSSGGNGRFLGSYSFGSLENPESFVINIPKERKAEIVKKHLVTDEDLARSSESNGISPDPIYLYSTSYKLPGGEATNEIYKWQKDVENEPMKRTRSRSLYIPRPLDPDTSNIREPGGFRRHHVLMKARKEGKEPNIITRNFIDFLTMFGHFAGEDLSDDEDDEDDDDEEVISELTPLIQRDGHANASPSKAVFLLLKSFVGTGVMFLPKAYVLFNCVFNSFGKFSCHYCVIKIFSKIKAYESFHTNIFDSLYIL